MARALINYNEGKPSEALSNLKKVVSLNPKCPPDVWLSIGIVYLKI